MGEYYDKGGNLGVKNIGFVCKRPECIEFASKDKKDVEHFIDGVQHALNVAVTAVEAWNRQNESQVPTPHQNGVETVLAHLKMILR